MQQPSNGVHSSSYNNVQHDTGNPWVRDYLPCYLQGLIKRKRTIIEDTETRLPN